jgi:hypothetical protein
MFHVVAYGAEVMAEPMFVPSTMNWTFATATLSEAVAVSVTNEPETVAPSEGAVMETDGRIVEGAVRETDGGIVFRAPLEGAGREADGRVESGAATITLMSDVPCFLAIVPETWRVKASSPAKSGLAVYENPEPIKVTWPYAGGAMILTVSMITAPCLIPRRQLRPLTIRNVHSTVSEFS